MQEQYAVACPGGGLILEWHPAEPAEDQYIPPGPVQTPCGCCTGVCLFEVFSEVGRGAANPLFKVFVLLVTHFLY